MLLGQDTERFEPALPDITVALVARPDANAERATSLAVTSSDSGLHLHAAETVGRNVCYHSLIYQQHRHLFVSLTHQLDKRDAVLFLLEEVTAVVATAQAKRTQR